MAVFVQLVVTPCASTLYGHRTRLQFGRRATYNAFRGVKIRVLGSTFGLGKATESDHMDAKTKSRDMDFEAAPGKKMLKAFFRNKDLQWR